MKIDWKRRLPLALLGLFFLGLGACVALWGVWETHGRGASQAPVTVVLGPATRWIGASLACTGIALLGVLWPRPGVVAAWMTVWLVAAVGLNFVEAPDCQRVERSLSLCR